jgi:hypothetical protein
MGRTIATKGFFRIQIVLFPAIVSQTFGKGALYILKDWVGALLYINIKYMLSIFGFPYLPPISSSIR